MVKDFQTEWQNLEQIQTGKNLEGKISSLETQIISQFKISYSRLPELVRFSSEKWRDALKLELKSELTKNTWETLVDTPIDYDMLASKIEELWLLKDELKKQVRAWIEWLNAELAKLNWNNELTNPKLISKILPKNLIKRAENPQNVWDQILWLWIWTVESVAITWKFVWETAIWILKSPYDLYQIATWKAKYEWTSKV
jgi:hypothetical protein